MSISMYQAFIPPTIRTLTNLAAILDKIAAHAEAHKVDPAVFVAARLFPDMLPFVKQVQIASDTVKGGAARLAGQEAPKFEDDEASFPELHARIQKTIAYLKGFQPEQIDGSEDKDITLVMRNGELHFKGLAYLTSYVLPNLYFHVTTAYAIARSNGVDLGKRDFLGQV